ncbi:MAG TPA: DUF4760 domain-containing protein [Chloroflexia bacterium]|nr:DUF4760 domain-containing protein [Chloroflexia bacterium]
MSNANPPPGATPPSEPTVGYLQFYRRWDTPLDDDATRAFSRLVRNAPDFAAFQALAPAGSEERRLFLRHIDSFEEAAGLLQQGQMSEDLFFDAWYAMPQSWDRAAPFVLGLRVEARNPELYAQFEWLAGRATQFWAERERNPPVWQPIEDRAPGPGDEAIFAAFHQIWSTPRDEVAWAFVTDLAQRAPDFATFSQLVPPGSVEYIKFDRVFCAYDQAGTLMKNGIIHPALFFDAWQSPGAVWAYAQPWLQGLREQTGNPHICENLDWLVMYESAWRNRAG